MSVDKGEERRGEDPGLNSQSFPSLGMTPKTICTGVYEGITGEVGKKSLGVVSYKPSVENRLRSGE